MGLVVLVISREDFLWLGLFSFSLSEKKCFIFLYFYFFILGRRLFLSFILLSGTDFMCSRFFLFFSVNWELYFIFCSPCLNLPVFNSLLFIGFWLLIGSQKESDVDLAGASGVMGFPVLCQSLDWHLIVRRTPLCLLG